METPDLDADKKLEKQKRREEAGRKFLRNGFFGVTSSDHRDIGSTPYPELIENPGKTFGELWSDEKILANLDEMIEAKKRLDGLKETYPKNLIIKDALRSFEGDLMRDLGYLESIDRCPDKYRDFDIESIKSERERIQAVRDLCKKLGEILDGKDIVDILENCYDTEEVLGECASLLIERKITDNPLKFLVEKGIIEA